MTCEFRSEDRYRQSVPHVFKSPKHITITVPYIAYENLLERSDSEGRSLSNLAAFLLESELGQQAKY